MGAACGKSSRKREFKVMLNGLDGSGKTTILYRLKMGQSLNTIPTSAFDTQTIEHNNVKLETWDIGGAYNNRHKYEHLYNELNAFIFVVDSSDEDRIFDARKELHYFAKDGSLKHVVFVVVANKRDLPGALALTEIYEKLDIAGILYIRVCEVFGTVATTGEGLNEMLEWLIDVVTRKQEI